MEDCCQPHCVQSPVFVTAWSGDESSKKATKSVYRSDDSELIRAHGNALREFDVGGAGDALLLTGNDILRSIELCLIDHKHAPTVFDVGGIQDGTQIEAAQLPPRAVCSTDRR